MNEEESKNVSLFELSHKTKLFVLFQRRSCPDCTRILGIWNHLGELYDNNTNVNVVTLYCGKNDPSCLKYYPYTHVPTFVYIINGKAYQVNPKPSLESYIDHVRRLENIELTVHCKKLPNDYSNYPYFVFYLNETSSCEIIRKFRLHYGKGYNLFIGEPGNNRSILEAHLSPEKINQYHGSKDVYDISKFIIDMKLEPFGNWSLRAGRFTYRRFSFLIYYNYTDVDKFKAYLDSYTDRVVFGIIQYKILIRTFGYLPLKASDCPTFAFADKHNIRFMLYRKANTDVNLTKMIDNVLSNKMESRMNYMLKYLFYYGRSTKPIVRKHTLIYVLVAFGTIFYVTVMIVKKANICTRRISRGKYYVEI